MTPHELSLIEHDAAANGFTVASYLRWLAIDQPETRPVRRPLADVRILSQIKGEVGRLGGNLHQLLRLANRGELPDGQDISLAAREVGAFLSTARELLRNGD